jgi:hypothetical protein
VAPERPHHGSRDIVTAVHATWISTREKEKRRRRIDDNAPDVLWLGRASLLLDFEAEAQEVGGLGV